MPDLKLGNWLSYAIQTRGASLQLTRQDGPPRRGEWVAVLTWPNLPDRLQAAAMTAQQALDDLDALVLDDASTEVLKGEPTP